MNFWYNSTVPFKCQSFTRQLSTQKPRAPSQENVAQQQVEPTQPTQPTNIQQDPYSPQRSPPPAKSFAFSLAALRKYYELTPIVVSVGIGLCFGAYSVFRAFRKDDVVFDKHKELPPWERIDLEKKELTSKNIVVGQKFHGLPELKQLKDEINELEGISTNNRPSKLSKLGFRKKSVNGEVANGNGKLANGNGNGKLANGKPNSKPSKLAAGKSGNGKNGNKNGNNKNGNNNKTNKPK